MFFFLVREIAVRLDHQVDIFFNLCPAYCEFLMFRVMVKFKPLAIAIYKSAAAVQKIMGVSADAIFRGQCFGTELSVLLGLV